MSAHVDFELTTVPGGTDVLAWVKLAWRIDNGALEPDSPSPLAHPMHREKRITPGSDYWPFKRHTDVVVVGAAHTPEHKPQRALDVCVSVGAREKRVRATGLRQVSWRTGERPSFPEPEVFTEIPLAYGNAYGGVDGRVVDPERAVEILEGVPLTDHPGMYPRNPFGRGYVVLPDGADGVDLPFLEDPSDLLTPERFITGDPARWHHQPLPAGLGWIHPWMFPRALFFDVEADAWHPAPDDDALREVREAVLPPRYRAVLDEYQTQHGPHEGFFQESSLGMRFAEVPAGMPVTLKHVHPAHPTLSFRAPATPKLTWRFEGELTPVAPRLHHMVIEPDALRVSCTYATEVTLPRTVIPGIHGHIPLALQVDDRWCPYEAPQTVLAAMREAGVEPLSIFRS